MEMRIIRKFIRILWLTSVRIKLKAENIREKNNRMKNAEGVKQFKFKRKNIRRQQTISFFFFFLQTKSTEENSINNSKSQQLVTLLYSADSNVRNCIFVARDTQTFLSFYVVLLNSQTGSQIGLEH